MSPTLVNLVALGLLGGAVAKSAQIPLHTWLPDAMEGPTPVSALIHAATMVTAGVYLIVRTHPLFELAPDVSDLAAILGAVTLLVAGLDRARPDRHQARDRVLDDVADRLHVPRRRARRVRQRDVPPDDARLLQGAALPRGRDRHPPPRRRAGHPQDGRPPASRCRGRTLAFLVGSLALVGISAVRGLLLQGRDPRRRRSPPAATASCSSPPGSSARSSPGSTPSGSTSSSSAASRRRSSQRALPRATATARARWTMIVPVGVLAVLAVIGGLLQFAGRLAPLRRLARPVAVGREHAALEPTVTQDWRRRARSRSALGARRDLASPGLLRRRKRARCRGWSPCRRRSSTSSTSTSSTTSSSTSRPSSSRRSSRRASRSR